MKKVLVVEDHDLLRHWWEKRLVKLFESAEVSGAVSLGEARSLIAEQHFSLVLVDIGLPDGSGIDLVRELSEQKAETYCVITTIFDDDRHIFEALRAGAKGYLIKDQPREHQLEQLYEITTGQPPLSPGVARRILHYFSDQAPMEEGEGLTAREKEVLSLFAKGYSRPKVAETLGLTLNTISSYTKIIYQKLGVNNRAEAVIEAIRLGLVHTHTD